MDNYLIHYGSKGMHWGERRWQNEDGSLTPAGRIHYGVGPPNKTAFGDAKSRAIAKDDKWAKNHAASIMKKVSKKSARELAKFDKSKEMRALKGKAFVNAHNRKMAELMNRDAAALKLMTPEKRAIRFVALRGELGVNIFLGDASALSQYSKGVWSDGRTAYTKHYTKMA